MNTSMARRKHSAHGQEQFLLLLLFYFLFYFTASYMPGPWREKQGIELKLICTLLEDMLGTGNY